MWIRPPRRARTGWSCRCWLRAAAGADAVRVRGVPRDTDPAGCALAGRELGAELGATGDPVALLVLGDGAITHTLRAPGYLDERAAGFDAAVAAALGGPDFAALGALDAGLATELGAAGRAAWQVGAAAAAVLAPAWRGELLHSAAPYGVAYHVAVWEPAP